MMKFLPKGGRKEDEEEVIDSAMRFKSWICYYLNAAMKCPLQQTFVYF